MPHHIPSKSSLFQSTPSAFTLTLLTLTLAIISSLWFQSHSPSTSFATSPTSPPTTSAPTPASAPAPSSAKPNTIADLLGITPIQQLLGPATPTGRNIIVGHVEGSPGDYLPQLTSPLFNNVQLIPRSGPSKSNGHTQAVSQNIYGPAGMAPGIPQVQFFSSNHWLDFGCLNISSHKNPDPANIRIFTNSWIAPAPDPKNPNAIYDPAYLAVLHRVDWLIDQKNVLIVCGVNNWDGKSSPPPVPPLLASAYNVISVGTYSGMNSAGYTQIDTPGRCKPDIIAPGQLTSFSTPLVTAVCARLLETADQHPQSNLAKRSDVIRAVLYAGADKPHNWKPQPGKPLDQRMGAGLVRFDHSYHILTSGPITTGRLPLTGWLTHQAPPASVSKTASFFLHITQKTNAASIFLLWNRHIDGRTLTDFLSNQPRWIDQPSLAHFTLKLSRLNPTPLSPTLPPTLPPTSSSPLSPTTSIPTTNNNPTSSNQPLPDNNHSTTSSSITIDDPELTTLIAQSDSPIDNLQHIYLPQLPPGHYRIDILRTDPLPSTWPLALTWRIQP